MTRKDKRGQERTREDKRGQERTREDEMPSQAKKHTKPEETKPAGGQ
jgi:hypothetical protein